MTTTTNVTKKALESISKVKSQKENFNSTSLNQTSNLSFRKELYKAAAATATRTTIYYIYTYIYLI